MNTLNLDNIQGINHYLDYLESIPVQAGEKIHESALELVGNVSGSLQGGNESLINRIVSLRYRLGLENRSHINENLCMTLDPLFPEKPGKRAGIEEVSRYSLFAQRLIADITLQNEFYQWVIIFGNQLRPLIEFPATVKKIMDCGLGLRIGFYGGDALQIVDGERKLLTLPFEGVRINILNEDAIVKLKNNYQLTIAKVYEIFADRVLQMGNLEFLPTGICNWNPKKLGPYNPSTGNYDIEYLDLIDWWNWLPWIEQLSIQKASERYEVACDGIQWVFTVKASRERPSLNVVGTHSYMEVAIPNATGYNIYYFGKFSTERFPQTTLQNLSCITAVFPAAVCYPDENIFNLHREHIGHSSLATPEEGINLMRSIRKDITNSMNGNFYFQLMNENCCKWVWKKLRHHLGQERIPELFSISFMEVEVDGAVGRLFNRIRNLPEKRRNGLLSFLFFVVGGWRSKKVIKKNGTVRKIGVFHNPTWKFHEKFMHPPRLFSKKALISSFQGTL